MVVLYALVFYFVANWTIPRFIVPHFGWRKEHLPDTIPADFAEEIAHLSAAATDNFDFLKKAYDFVTTRYHGSRVKTVTNFWTAFEEPIGHAPGFMPCTGQNYLLRLILIKSGRFRDEDVEVRTTVLNLFLHQYLRVNVGGRWIDVDPWSSFLGVPLGQKCHFIK